MASSGSYWTLVVHMSPPIPQDFPGVARFIAQIGGGNLPVGHGQPLMSATRVRTPAETTRPETRP